MLINLTNLTIRKLFLIITLVRNCGLILSIIPDKIRNVRVPIHLGTTLGINMYIFVV